MPMEKTVLVVEDEANIVTILTINLEKEGYRVLSAYDGQAGLELARREKPDLILLDLMLPKPNGFEVCRTLRDGGDTVPILMLTAREEESDKVKGLELGADDYITKPFSMRELLARVKSNIRRVAMPPRLDAGADLVTLGRLRLDNETATAYKDGEPLELSQREYELLSFLTTHPDKVFSREELMEHVWNYEGYVGDVRGVDVAVRRLREKLEDDPATPRFVVTRRGLGYYFSSHPDEK